VYEQFFRELVEQGVYRLGNQIDGTPGDAAQAESEAFASVARSAVEEGWPVSDRGLDGERIVRPANSRDICILLPARIHLRLLERALETAGVPYSVEAGKLVLATQEVRDLLSCLRAIEDPSDQVALVAACARPPTPAPTWTCCNGSRAAVASTTNTLAMGLTGR
jgi:ATP-dependent exoDNAse (exonuclease V) beta subunit